MKNNKYHLYQITGIDSYGLEVALPIFLKDSGVKAIMLAEAASLVNEVLA